MSPTLRHDALIYGSDEEFVGTVVPFLLDGVVAGEGVVVATRDRNEEILRRALGSDATKVLFVPDADVYRSPIAAIQAYDAVLDAFRREGRRSVRAIGEVRYGSSAAELEAWRRYESVAHHVFAEAPLHVICPYDARALAPGLIDHARATHPMLHEGLRASESPAFIEPEAVVRSHPETISFALPADPDLSVAVDGSDPGDVRRAVAATVADALPPHRAEEALLAVAEIIANGMRHGTGAVVVDLWTVPEAVACSVRNEGPPIEDPFVGFHPPADHERGGMGVWIARQLADEVEVRNGERGPVVTLAFRR